MEVIRTWARGAWRDSKMPLYTGGSGTYRDLPAYMKRDISNERDLQELAESGLFDDFRDFEKETWWEKAKKLGSGALDVLSRGEYATVAAKEAADQGENPAQAIAREIFSGVGDVKGRKKTWGEHRRETDPEYKQYSKEHPYSAIAQDFTTSMLGDPTVLIPGAAFARVGRGASKGIGAVARAITPEPIRDMLGKTFSTAQPYIKGAEDIGLPAERGRDAYNIMQQEFRRSKAREGRYANQFKPITDWLRNKNVSPETKQEYIRVMRDSTLYDAAPDEVKAMVDETRPLFKSMGRHDYMTLNKELSGLKEDYLPNKPRTYTDLQETSGELGHTGHGRGMTTQKPGFMKQQKLTGDEMVQFLEDTGVKPENVGEAVARSIEGRAKESISTTRNQAIFRRLADEMPDMVRELKPGTKVPWDEQVRPGETILMPAGNLKFFEQEALRINKPIREMLSRYDEFSKAREWGDDTGMFFTPDELYDLVKKFPSVSTKVKAYAVPLEMHKAMMETSKRLADPDSMLNYWDKLLNIFKNTAILSPVFHARNFISSGAQNYVAGMNPARYLDAARAVYADPGAEVMGKSAARWRAMFEKNGITQGSLIGQNVGKTAILGAEKVFDFNRKIGTQVERFHRAALFMDGVKKGMKPADAAERVKKFHFDYQDLTPTEVGFRRLVPFYAWTRNNVPLQLEMLLKAPQKYRNIAKLKESASGGENSDYAPEWWRDQDVWETRITNKKGERQAVSVGLPYADLNQFSRSSVGMLGPAGALYNLAANYDPFKDRQIQGFRGEKATLFQAGPHELRVNPKLRYAMENLVPAFKRYGIDASQELSNFIETGDEGELKKLLSKVTGIKTMSLTREREEKNRVYKLMKMLRDYRLYREQEGESQDGRR